MYINVKYNINLLFRGHPAGQKSKKIAYWLIYLPAVRLNITVPFRALTTNLTSLVKLPSRDTTICVWTFPLSVALIGI